MAMEVKTEKSLEKMMHNLKVDPSSKVVDTKMVPSTNRRPPDSISCISSTADATSSSTKGSDMDQESVSTEQGMYYPPSNYYGYYYPGYDGSSREWGDQGYAVGFDGLDTQYPGVQMENGSLLYYMPGYGYVHPPLSPYTQPPIVDVDGQRLGQQPYFASPMLPQVSPPGYLPPPVLYGSEVMPAYSWDVSPFFVDAAQTNGVRRGSVSSGEKSVPPAPNHQSLVPHAKPPQSVKSNTLLDVKATTPSLDLPSNQGGISVANIHNQSVKPVNKVSQSGVGFEPTAVLAKGYFPISTFPAYSNQNKGPLFYPSSFVGLQLNGRGLTGSEKLKTRNKMGGVGDFDPLNEQNRGPRINNNRNSWVSDANLVGDSGCLSSENNGKVNNLPVIRRDQYNLPDFPIKYEDALFFVIKSYGEDDIHKSIKYSVWASTPNGNKRIDSAYQDSQKRCKEKTNSKCPVFLFFSVNASGQFCGVAEMTRKVDFNKSMNFWQQDKCNGFFPVKWHIIKDVPNPQFRHIILENNDNKPVTNSRDTQEVRFPQGIEMLRIFKNYSSKTSILDDFDFYESRQKAMLDKRVRSPALLESSLHNKPVEAIPTAAANESDMPKPAVSNASQLMGSATSKRNHDGQLEDSAE